jgi:hypothetical protein
MEEVGDQPCGKPEGGQVCVWTGECVEGEMREGEGVRRGNEEWKGGGGGVGCGLCVCVCVCVGGEGRAERGKKQQQQKRQQETPE